VALIKELLIALGDSPIASILAKVTITTALALVGAELARRSRAAVRHILLSAAFAVLIVLPLASIVAPAIQVRVPVAAREGVGPSVTGTIVDAVSLSIPASAGVNSARSTAGSIVVSLSALWLSAWAAGALLFLLPIVVGLWQMRSLCRTGVSWTHGRSVAGSLAVGSGIRRRVEVLLHESAPGPMTCGVVRPTIVLPLDARTWNDEDLRRAIVHELEHVRRGDWISQCVARTACAVYWFHPLVWVAWRRLSLEAERSCDDAVLRVTDAPAYADQLVQLAERLAATTKRAFLAMANRADLATRVNAVLDDRQRRGRAAAPGVACACASVALVVAIVSPLRVVASPVQVTPSAQKFETASIKRCAAEPIVPGARAGGVGPVSVSPGRVYIPCATLEALISIAYTIHGEDLQNEYGAPREDNPRIRGGPAWGRSEKFAIEANAGGTPDRQTVLGPMLRALLEDRFRLKSHRELEEIPIYALAVAKGGLKITPLSEGGCMGDDQVARALDASGVAAAFRTGKPVCGSILKSKNGSNDVLELGGVGLDFFAELLFLDHRVVDRTGVAGTFNIRLEYAPDEHTPKRFEPATTGADASDPGPTIFHAIEQQLGLTLQLVKGPHGFIVIDRVERPTPDFAADAATSGKPVAPSRARGAGR